MKRPRTVSVTFTEREISCLLTAIGNSLTGDPDDESAIVGEFQDIRAAYRGQFKLRRALRSLQ